ncbi:MAG: hypothetical protein IPM21_05380 [Acidobacteria bacterium]|nr:hypothetical protein [Acidobacteriota bacterium]
MTNEELLKELETLQPRERGMIEKLIMLFKGKRDGGVTAAPKKSFRDEKSFGMWKDRDDMKDSVEWVRNIRRTHWGPKSS